MRALQLRPARRAGQRLRAGWLGLLLMSGALIGEPASSVPAAADRAVVGDQLDLPHLVAPAMDVGPDGTRVLVGLEPSGDGTGRALLAYTRGAADPALSGPVVVASRNGIGPASVKVASDGAIVVAWGRMWTGTTTWVVVREPGGSWGVPERLRRVPSYGPPAIVAGPDGLVAVTGRWSGSDGVALRSPRGWDLLRWRGGATPALGFDARGHLYGVTNTSDRSGIGEARITRRTRDGRWSRTRRVPTKDDTVHAAQVAVSPTGKVLVVNGFVSPRWRSTNDGIGYYATGTEVTVLPKWGGGFRRMWRAHGVVDVTLAGSPDGRRLQVTWERWRDSVRRQPTRSELRTRPLSWNGLWGDAVVDVAALSVDRRGDGFETVSAVGDDGVALVASRATDGSRLSAPVTLTAVADGTVVGAPVPLAGTEAYQSELTVPSVAAAPGGFGVAWVRPTAWDRAEEWLALADADLSVAWVGP